MSEPKYTIDVNQAKEILDVSRKTIYRRLKSGELDGKKVPTDNTMKWMINEDDIQQAKRVKESVEVVEVEENISKKQLLNSIQEAVNANLSEDIKQTEDNIKESMKRQNEQLQEEIKTLSEKVDQLQQQQNKNLWDRFKNIFR